MRPISNGAELGHLDVLKQLSVHKVNHPEACTMKKELTTL